MKTTLDCLMSFPVCQLKDLAYRFQAEQPAASARAAWSQAVLDTYQEAEGLLDYLPLDEWYDLQEHLQAVGTSEEGAAEISLKLTYEDEVLRLALNKLKQTGLVWQNRHGILYVQPEVVRAAALAQKKMEDRESAERIYGILRGYLWLYGILPVSELEKLLAQSVLPVPELERLLAQSILPGSGQEKLVTQLMGAMRNIHRKRMGIHGFIEHEGEEWLVGEDVDEPKKLLERVLSPKLRSRPYAVYDAKEALTISIGEGNYRWNSFCVMARDVYEALGMEREEAEAQIEWVICLYRNDNMEGAADVLTDVPWPPTPEQLRKLIAFMDYVPLWHEKGYSMHDLKPSPRRSPGRVGRNDPCPCGSGRKYKNCCGRLQ